MISTDRLIEIVEGAIDLDPLVLEDMETRAVAFIQSQTRRYFGSPVEVTEYLSGNGSRTLRLPEPVVLLDSDDAIESVEERAYPGGEATLILDSEFEVRESGTTSKLVRLGGPVWLYGYEYSVTFTRGYEVDAGPKDIEDLIMELIKHKLKFADKSGMRAETIGGYSYTRFGDSDLDAIDGAKDTIAAWRRTVLV